MLASASPQGVKYNIPVCFWLPEGYPRQGPLCFVTPTPDMVVKPGHPCVDANGAVAAPYLQRWTFPSHTLCGCAAQLAELFSRDPPLYSKPPAGAPPREQLLRSTTTCMRGRHRRSSSMRSSTVQHRRRQLQLLRPRQRR